MRTHTQPTYEQPSQIYALLKAGKNLILEASPTFRRGTIG